MKIANKLTCSFFTAALLTVFSATAPAQSAPTVPTGSDIERFAPADVGQVRLLLSGYHGLPEQDLLTAVPDAYGIVSALTADSNALVRDRALEALGRFWPSGDVFLRFATVLADPATPEGQRHRIMLTAADVFGERAVPMLRPYLSVEDVQLRLTAVEALGRVRTDEVVALLNASRATEANPVVLERIDKATRVLR